MASGFVWVLVEPMTDHPGIWHANIGEPINYFAQGKSAWAAIEAACETVSLLASGDPRRTTRSSPRSSRGSS